MRSYTLVLGLFASLFCLLPLQAQQARRRSVRAQDRPAPQDMAAVKRGATQFQSTCGFCHGNDATGGRGPDLIRSAILGHDVKGDLLTPVIRNGRPDKGMPAFSTLTDDQISDIVAFLHNQAYEALHSGHVPSDYPLSKLLTGNANEGKAFFNGAGRCSQCHSVTGDLAGIANKYSPIDLQQHMVYPSKRGAPNKRTATVTLADGTRFEGKVVHEDEFNIGIVCQDGWYRSWPRADVKVEVKDPLKAHRDLMYQYTDADIHNVFAYLETLK